MKNSGKKILDTAERLFYRDGFGHVGVDTIRDESGCAKTTMYHHFGSKEKLIHEVLKYRDERLRTSLQAFIGDEVCGREAVYKVFDWFHQRFIAQDFNGCLFVRAAAELDDEAKSIAIVHKRAVTDFICAKLQPDANARVISEQLVVLLEGMVNIYTIYEADTELCERYMASSKETAKLILDAQLGR
ncbi:TetR/AcrR family transcriptional regulator [Cardiobacteriaceae bacterium TAE3-ERU3]|nr:TetR/AcrR family transcriptional regulator [Cardiobacteriaceae bacterium TAE3-ERU3]